MGDSSERFGEPLSRHLIPFAEKYLHVRTLHLDADPSKILAEVSELAGVLSASRPGGTVLSAVS